MWSSFYFQVFIYALLIYVPGFFLLRGLRFSRIIAVVCAPIFSILGFYSISFIYSVSGQTTSWIEVFFSCLGVFLIPFFITLIRKKKKTSCDFSEMPESNFRNTWLCLAWYVFFASIVATYFFVRSLDGPASIYQENDNIFHLEMIRSFIDGGVFFPSWNSTYPSAWHSVVALGINLTGIDIGIGINAFNYLLLAVVFPSSIFLFLNVLFPTEKKVVWWGSLVSIAFAAFPWGFLIFGPLYPNLAGYVFLPIAMSMFFFLVKKKETMSFRIRNLAAFLLSGVALVFLHPNAIFTGIVLLSPYCVYLIVDRVGDSSGEKKTKYFRKILFSFLFVGLVVLFWTLLFNSKFFSGVVWFEWGSFASKSQAVANAIMLSLTVASAPQFLLSFIVICGFLYALCKKGYRWISFSYLIVLLMYVVNASSDGFWSHFLTGFWYTDSFRVAAMVALAGIPLAAMGLFAVFEIVKRIASLISIKQNAKKNSVLLSTVVAGLFVFMNYYPNFEIPHNTSVVTGFGMVEQMLEGGNRETPNIQVFDSEEIAFVKKVHEVVPEDSVIINLPYDGSIYSHALYGLNIMYRVWYGYSSIDEATDGALIRGQLSSIEYNDDVKSAVSRKHSNYLLLLDQGNQDGEGMYTAPYKQDLWIGISSVTDETPGFEIVLAENDMRLYKINC